MNARTRSASRQITHTRFLDPAFISITPRSPDVTGWFHAMPSLTRTIDTTAMIRSMRCCRKDSRRQPRNAQAIIKVDGFTHAVTLNVILSPCHPITELIRYPRIAPAYLIHQRNVQVNADRTGSPLQNTLHLSAIHITTFTVLNKLSLNFRRQPGICRDRDLEADWHKVSKPGTALRSVWHVYRFPTSFDSTFRRVGCSLQEVLSFYRPIIVWKHSLRSSITAHPIGILINRYSGA